MQQIYFIDDWPELILYNYKSLKVAELLVFIVLCMNKISLHLTMSVSFDEKWATASLLLGQWNQSSKFYKIRSTSFWPGPP